MPLLFEAGRAFVRSASGDALRAFQRFQADNSWWLDDFVLFDALRARQKLKSWNQWPRDLAHRETAALEKARKELADDIQIRSALQFAFYEQWRALRRYCSERAIRVVGDVAIFMNHDSADVWAHRELFRLERKSRAGSCRRSSSRLFQQDRTALGKSAVPLGCDEATRLSMVDSAPALGHGKLRLHSAGPFPRLRSVLGDPCDRRDCGEWPLGRWPAR